MFSEKPPGVVQPASYAALKTSKTLIIKDDEHDVFGDGTVVIKSAPGDTPGHQVLYLKLRRTGGVVLSGDLYHFRAARVTAASGRWLNTAAADVLRVDGAAEVERRLPAKGCRSSGRCRDRKSVV